ncbi:hypothetical protein IWX76_001177 [Pedobacter sp. CAN_A7]|uniref:hypothetical protein n=1 Tax=Pedobacter sp. CAN_A7 TaxID=2787722 RepID=UPI0018CAD348
MRLLSIICFLLLITGASYAQQSDINNFIIKESLLKNSKLAIIAADSVENPLEQINGNYTFSVSGFKQALKFNEGVAILPLQLERSTFVYIKHINDQGTHSKLVFVHKKEGTLTPYVISAFGMILFPLIVIVIAFMFRKLLIIAIIILVVFVYFNHSNGLDLSTLLETLFDSIKMIF